MAAYHVLSYISLFSLLIWTYLFVMAFLGRGWVVMEIDLGLQDLIRQQSNNKPSSGSSLDSIISNYLPQSLGNIGKNVPFDENSLTTIKISYFAGFQQFCMNMKFDGNVKALQAVDASVCFDNDLINHPEKFNLPTEYSTYTNSIFDKLNSAKMSMIAGLLFTGLAIVISLIKPCLLKWKTIQYILHWTIVAAALVSLICAGSAIGHAKKNQDNLETSINYVLVAEPQYSSLLNVVHRTGDSIYYSAVGIVAAIVVAVINMVGFCLLKKNKGVVSNYNNFDMSA